MFLLGPDPQGNPGLGMDMIAARRNILLAITRRGSQWIFARPYGPEGAELQRQAPAPGGTRVPLEFQDACGAARNLLLSLDDLSRLLTTLPRRLRDALVAHCPDDTQRVVQRLGGWRIEQADGANGATG